MKKIILSITFIAFVFSMNAQKSINPNDIKNPTQPKSKEKLISPNNDNFLHEKTYNGLGWVSSFRYMVSLGIPDMDQSYIVTSYRNLSPDSCLRAFFGDEEFGGGLPALGMCFDPYSKSFDDDLINSTIIPTPPNPTHPYRLDTLILQGIYREGRNNNSANLDTLRVYISYLEPYKEQYDYYTELHHTSDVNSDTTFLLPKVVAYNNHQPKGGYVIPKAPNTLTIDYVLNDGDFSRDTIIDGEETTIYSTFIIPLTYNGVTVDGFEIPSGGVISVITKFIPGYDYELGDTLYYGEKDPLNPERYADGYPIYVNNTFGLRWFFRQENKEVIPNAFSDPFGYNTTFFEYTNLRYQYFGNFLDSCYYPVPDYLPYMYFHLSVDEEKWDSIPYSINEVNDIVSKIYPNPANDNITIQLKNADQAIITIYNIVGQEIRSITTNNIETSVNIADLRSGIYLVKVNQKGKVFTGKISKQ